ncbi:RloB family protein [Streptosporangium saharense]|uniref:RloB family protein n=1 Tax=Streptosporangium saharense TaxID=1706840 RepID=UPI0036817D4D
MTSRRASRPERRGVVVGLGREEKPGRKKSFRRSRPTVLIVTNGEKTEMQYFEALKDDPWERSYHVSFKRGDPRNLVREGSLEKANSGYDTVWCVCDVDHYEVSNLIREARNLGVEVALSRPCFEVWLILHRKDFGRPLQNAGEAKREIRKILPWWDKTALRIEDFRDGIAAATSRAKKLAEPPLGNPSTDVWKVVEFLGTPEEDDA